MSGAVKHIQVSYWTSGPSRWLSCYEWVGLSLTVTHFTEQELLKDFNRIISACVYAYMCVYVYIIYIKLEVLNL